MEFSARLVPGIHTHGTGCTYSAAITAALAKGADLPQAVKSGKQFVLSAIRWHFVWNRRGGKISALNQSLRFREP
jgi:hydroxymethylpyrimidine/phosphomethylpyrimidine kinase